MPRQNFRIFLSLTRAASFSSRHQKEHRKDSSAAEQQQGQARRGENIFTVSFPLHRRARSSSARVTFPNQLLPHLHRRWKIMKCRPLLFPPTHRSWAPAATRDHHQPTLDVAPPSKQTHLTPSREENSAPLPPKESTSKFQLPQNGEPPHQDPAHPPPGSPLAKDKDVVGATNHRPGRPQQ